MKFKKEIIIFSLLLLLMTISAASANDTANEQPIPSADNAENIIIDETNMKEAQTQDTQEDAENNNTNSLPNVGWTITISWCCSPVINQGDDEINDTTLETHFDHSPNTYPSENTQDLDSEMGDTKDESHNELNENNEEKSEDYYPSEDIDEFNKYHELDDFKVIIKPNHKKFKVGDVVLWTITIKNIGHKTIRNFEFMIDELSNSDGPVSPSKTLSTLITKGNLRHLDKTERNYWNINYLKPGETIKIFLKSKILSPGALNIELMLSFRVDNSSGIGRIWESEDIIVENSTNSTANSESDYFVDSTDEPQIDNSNNCKNTHLEPEKTVNSSNSDSLILFSIVSLFAIVGVNCIRKD